MKQFLQLVGAIVTARIITALLGFGVLALIVLGVYLFGNGSDQPGTTSARAPESSQGAPETGGSNCRLDDDGFVQCGATIQPTSRPTSQSTDEKRVLVIGKARSEGHVTNLSDDEVWALATRTCNRLDAYHYWNEVKDRSDDVASFQQDAVHILCPFHDNEVLFTQ